MDHNPLILSERKRKGKIMGWGILIGLLFTFVLAVTTLSAKDLSYGSSLHSLKSKGGEVTYKLITVQEGDSLWQLINQAGLGLNTAILMERTMKYNDLKSTSLTTGQKIYIPSAD